jgi:hypothetical protein
MEGPATSISEVKLRKDRDSKVFQNTSILPQEYTVSQPRSDDIDLNLHHHENLKISHLLTECVQVMNQSQS